jgi:hypothetical protein
MGEWVYRVRVFLTSALVGGEWLASRLCRFTTGEKAPGTHWIGGWKGKAIPVTGREGPLGCETSRLPHFL